MRAKQPSAPGLPRGLTPPPPLASPPTPPAPPPVPSPPPAVPSFGAPPFMPTANPYAAGVQPAPPAAAPPQPGVAHLAPNPFAVSTTTDLDFPQPRKKTPLVVGAIVVVIAAGVGIFLATSGGHPAPPPVPAAAPVAPAPTVPTGGPTPTNTQGPDSPSTPPKQQDSIAGTPTPTATGGDFSAMFAQGAEKAQKGGSTGKAFDTDEARNAVSVVLKGVAACKEAGGPVGQANAAVTFDASGHVSGVTIGAPFSGTSTGTCIITAFKTAKVTPFAGLPGTISQPVSLQ